MTIIEAVGDGSSETETPLLDQLVPGSVDFNGRPSLRSTSGCWKSSVFIIAVGVAERFAYYGVSANLVGYLTGKLGQSTASAASIINAWFGTASLLPILGGFLADSFSGRFRMIIVSCILYIAALGFMTLSASLTSHDSIESKPTAGYTTSMFFFVSFYLVALAQGGYNPCKLLELISLMRKMKMNVEQRAHSLIGGIFSTLVVFWCLCWF